MKPLFLIVAKSGVGKDSITDRLCGIYNAKKVISYATRPRRIGESETHIFISPEEVAQYKSDIIAYTKIGEYEYFTTKDQLTDERNLFYIIDPMGELYLRSKFTERDIMSIYLTVDFDSQIARLKLRGDSDSAIVKRISAEEKQFSHYEDNKMYDATFENNDFLKTISDITLFIDGVLYGKN